MVWQGDDAEERDDLRREVDSLHERNDDERRVAEGDRREAEATITQLRTELALAKQALTHVRVSVCT